MGFRNLQDPESRLKSAITNAIYTRVAKSSGLRVRNPLIYLDYTMEDLRFHLESLFSNWMNWDNWGIYNGKTRTWQIDHKIPQSQFPYKDLDDPNFRQCWALSNLRPLETIDNLRKRDRHG